MQKSDLKDTWNEREPEKPGVRHWLPSFRLEILNITDNDTEGPENTLIS